jgi:hypothetical protein
LFYIFDVAAKNDKMTLVGTKIYFDAILNLKEWHQNKSQGLASK